MPLALNESLLKDFPGTGVRRKRMIATNKVNENWKKPQKKQ